MRRFLVALVAIGLLPSMWLPVHSSDWVEDDHDREIQGQAAAEPSVQAASMPRTDLDELLQSSYTSAPKPSVPSDQPALLDRVADLEKNVFGKSFEGDALLKRISDLELAQTSQDGIGVGSVEQRVNALAAYEIES